MRTKLSSPLASLIAGFTVVTALILGMATAAAAAVNVIGQNLQFTNTVKIGANAKVGFTTRYSNVTTGVDALLSVSAINNLNLDNVDRVSSTNNWQLWTNEAVGAGGGNATYHIEFVATGTNNPVTLQNMSINVGDIDARQYVQFAGPTSYQLGQNTQLTVKTNAQDNTIPVGAYRFVGPVAGSTDTDTRFWAQVNYSELSAVDVMLGAEVGGAALFQVSFGAASWSGQEATPVTPPTVQYTVSYEKNSSSASGTVPSTTGNSGAPQTISAVTGITNGSASFVGWNTAPDGSGVMYQATNLIYPTANVQLYAIWAVPATVTYFANNNAAVGAVPAGATLTGASSYTISAPGSLDVPGYKFVGWNTLANGSGAPYQPGEILWVEANTNFYAQWEIIPVVPGGIDIDVPSGQPAGGGDVPYNVPNLEPNSNYTLDVDPTDPNEPGQEIDAGTASTGGDASGTAELPNLPGGEYDLVFSGTDADGDPVEIIRHFTINSDGTMGTKSDAVRTSLAHTGMNLQAISVVAPFALLAVVAGVGLMLMMRRRAVRIRRAHDKH